MTAGSPAPAREPSSIYLDWNATTPPLPEVLEAMHEAGLSAWGNPSSPHAEGREARAVVESAREAIAELCGVGARDVILTGGATEANNLALRDAPALVTSRLEHPSVVRVAEALEAQGRTVRWLPVSASGEVSAADVRDALAGLAPGFVVALMAANHETGVVQPAAAVADAVQERGGRLHVDAVQAVGKLPSRAWCTGDTLAVAAHKLRGPKGIGALILRSSRRPSPVLLGGAQERGLRPGTLDPVGAAGFRMAALHALRGGPERWAALAPLRDRLERCASEHGAVNGAGLRLPHVTNISFKGWRGDELVAALDLAGVRASSGSACSAGTSEASPVIESMLGRAVAEASVRFSLGETTTSKAIDRAISLLIQVITCRTSPASRTT